MDKQTDRKTDVDTKDPRSRRPLGVDDAGIELTEEDLSRVSGGLNFVKIDRGNR